MFASRQCTREITIAYKVQIFERKPVDYISLDHDNNNLKNKIIKFSVSTKAENISLTKQTVKFVM
jgi:hypothetical protein